MTITSGSKTFARPVRAIPSRRPIVSSNRSEISSPARARAAACLHEAETALSEAGLATTHLAGIARWIVERRA